MPFASCSRRFAAALLLAFCAASAQAADLTVSVTGVKDAGHDVRIALYADADSFRHEAKAKQVLSVSAQPGTVTGVFRDLAPGRYALIAYHDENGNGKLDMILGMFPDEGWGLSNDPTVIGPPRFDDSSFTVAEPSSEVTVKLHY